MAQGKRAASAAPMEAPSGEIDLGPLDNYVGYSLRRAFLSSNLLFAEMLAPLGLAPGQYSVLKIIHLNQGRTQKVIADAAGIDQSSLVPVLDHLEAKGWIERAPGRDRRERWVMLTKAGQAFVAKVDERVADHESRMTSGLARGERQELLRLLKQVRQASTSR